LKRSPGDGRREPAGQAAKSADRDEGNAVVVRIPPESILGETTRSMSPPAEGSAMLTCDGSLRERDPRMSRQPDRGTGQDGTLEGTGHGIMGGEASDEELMARVAAAGDHAAFRTLMHRHMRRAIRVAQSIVTNAADADDIAQDAFLRIWHRSKSFDPALAKFTTWMHRIVVNLAIDRTRRPPTEPIDRAADVVDPGPQAIAILVEREQRRAMAIALARMPPRQRAALTLFHFEGLSGRECALVLGLGEKAFESLLIRARDALKHGVEAVAADPGSFT
jgi:RNA polymerase sigma-70 factor (ECF subfamily)